MKETNNYENIWNDVGSWDNLGVLVINEKSLKKEIELIVTAWPSMVFFVIYSG